MTPGEARRILMRAAEGGFFDEAPFEFAVTNSPGIALAIESIRKSPSRWVAERAAELLGYPVSSGDLRRGGAFDDSWSGEGWASKFWHTVFGRARARHEGKL
jgi:hypothetical protein